MDPINTDSFTPDTSFTHGLGKAVTQEVIITLAGVAAALAFKALIKRVADKHTSSKNAVIETTATESK